MSLRPAVYCLLMLLMSPSFLWASPAESVVKITAFTRFPDPMRPWEKGKPVEGFGSGVFIGNNRILTNSHIVNYATEIYVQWDKGGEKVEATLEAQAVELDLALITVSQPGFFAKRRPLKLSENLPKAKDEVVVYGYPRGGTGLSVTKGEISRINAINYGNQGHGLQIQISAPINPGNSGGPAIVRDEIAGLVYSNLPLAQSIGYAIPAEEIAFFLANIKNGQFSGKPRINALIDHQNLENESLRRSLGIDASINGVLITKSVPGLKLREMDILTKIGDHAIDNRGNVSVEQGVSVFFGYVVSKAVKNGSVPFTIRRSNKELVVNIPVDFDDPYIVKRYQGDPLPYFIHGPLVFVPARAEDVTDFYLRLNPTRDRSGLERRSVEYASFPGEELVVISAQFRNKIANGYNDCSGRMVQKINGVAVKNLRHAVELFRDAKDPFVTIELDDRLNRLFVFDRRKLDEVSESVLEDLGISPARRGSPDMMRVWRLKDR